MGFLTKNKLTLYSSIDEMFEKIKINSKYRSDKSLRRWRIRGGYDSKSRVVNYKGNVGTLNKREKKN